MKQAPWAKGKAEVSRVRRMGLAGEENREIRMGFYVSHTHCPVKGS